MNSISSSIKRSPLVAFFILAFAIEGIATLLFMRDATTLPFALVLVPTVAAVTVAAISEGWTGVKALLGRLLRWRVGLQWYAVVLGVPVLGSLAIVGSAALLGTLAEDLFGRLFTPATLIVLAVV